MKRIIIGISVLLMLVQSGFALSDAEYDKQIKNETDPIWKQIRICDKAALNNFSTADVDDCLKVIPLKENSQNKFSDKSFGIIYLNIGLLYDESKGDKLKAYEYYMKAARLGNIQAQKNLNIMCKESSWACK